ncbi:MAG: biopolymer transporter ExbD [Hydrogenobacter sp.]
MMEKLKLLILLLEEEQEGKEEIQIVPTIDVMLFLLVFFILYTLNVIPLFQQSILLPATKTAQEERKSKILRVYIDQEGRVKAENNLEGLQAIRNYIRENRQNIESVLIVADKRSKVEPLMQVLDLMKMEGISNVGIASEKK